MGLIVFFRESHSKAADYTFFSSSHGIFYRIEHVRTQQISINFNKFKKIEIKSSTFSDHNGMKLEISHKKITIKYTDMETNNM